MTGTEGAFADIQFLRSLVPATRATRAAANLTQLGADWDNSVNPGVFLRREL